MCACPSAGRAMFDRCMCLPWCSFTELDIEPPPAGTKVLSLHAHGLTIRSASINGIRVGDIRLGKIMPKDADDQVQHDSHGVAAALCYDVRLRAWSITHNAPRSRRTL